MKFYIALENLRSLHNIGAIFRTCSFFGFYNVLLVGYSGKARDHYDHTILHPALAKTSLGSVSGLNIEFLDTSSDLVAYCTNGGLELVAVEQDERSVNVYDWVTTLKRDTAAIDKGYVLVFGNEVTGVSTEILSLADKIVEIPRVGKKSSLNVATAAGLVMGLCVNLG